MTNKELRYWHDSCPIDLIITGEIRQIVIPIAAEAIGYGIQNGIFIIRLASPSCISTEELNAMPKKSLMLDTEILMNLIEFDIIPKRKKVLSIIGIDPTWINF
ncbi:MAG: hypothetical protein ACM3UU_06360 [Ignavibacteriales bacterium]